MSYQGDIPAELLELDERCKTWARVFADKTKHSETAIYRFMKQYGGYIPEKNKDDPEPLPPLSHEQILDAEKIERAWSSSVIPQRFKNMLLLWYFGQFNNVKPVCQIFKIRRHEVLPLLISSLKVLQTIVN